MSGIDALFMARRELREMDRTLGAGRDLVVEVSKALTLAETTPGAEVRVTCRTMADVVDAHRMLRGRHASGLGLVPLAAERGYEHPRGSLITVVWCGGSTWPYKKGVDVIPLGEEKPCETSSKR